MANEPRRSHVFISYVRENSETIEKLSDTLIACGITVWLDRNEIKPGFRWQKAIKDAIQGGDFFIACFSEEYRQRSKTYMNEELTLAIEELRQRPTDRAWFIPVLLPGGEVPDRTIGAGETLRSFQWVSLLEERWDSGIQQIISAVKSTLDSDKSDTLVPRQHEDDGESSQKSGLSPIDPAASSTLSTHQNQHEEVLGILNRKEYWVCIDDGENISSRCFYDTKQVMDFLKASVGHSYVGTGPTRDEAYNDVRRKRLG